MIDDDLKPCPFCGSRGATVFGVTNKGIEFFQILCVNQQCYIKTRRYHTRTEAKDSWNKRVKDVPMDCDEGRICPKCGKVMVLCEDEKTYHQIWECDGCGHKEDE